MPHTPVRGERPPARKQGQIIARGEHRWLVRVYLGRDQETRRRRYLSKTIEGSLRAAQRYLNSRLATREESGNWLLPRSPSINFSTAGSHSRLEQERSIAAAKRQVEAEIEEGIRKARQRIAEEEAKKARLVISDELYGKTRELADLQAILKAKDEKLVEAQRVQAEMMRKQRELDDARQEVDLTIEKRVQESLGRVRDRARREAEEQLKLKVAERDETIAGMQRHIEALKQKADQVSQQRQGEVQELALEALLSSKFPMDLIEPVPKGEFGGEIIHRVLGTSGQDCGTILWESKRTKNWSDGWLVKLREDQRRAKAEIAALVSRALPKDLESFLPD